MGDVLSTHLDDARRQHIAEKTGKVLNEFLRFYEDQYGVALFNSMRHEIEGTGSPQAQLLWRKVPLEERVIFSGNLFQYQEDSKKWRNRYSLVPHNYGLVLYENKVAYERQVPPRAIINSAGYKILTSVDQYLELVGNSLPGVASKSGSAPILKCPTQFPLILWHPYARHYYFCMMTEAEQDKWQAVLQDCVRHCNNGIPEDSKVEGPAFTDAIRMYRQSKELYGTWEMLCGNEVQILSNLVLEELGPELKAELAPRLKGNPKSGSGSGSRSQTLCTAWCMSRPRRASRPCCPSCSRRGRPWRPSSARTWTRSSPPRSTWPARSEPSSSPRQRCACGTTCSPTSRPFWRRSWCPPARASPRCATSSSRRSRT